MNKKINYGMIFSVVLAVMLLAGAGFYVNTTNDLKNTIQDRDEVINDKDNEISNLANEVSTLSQKVVEVVEETVNGNIEEVEDIVGYLIDELLIGDNVGDELDKTLTDRELNLLDSKVDFVDATGDEESYDIDEYFDINGIKLTVNEEDFGENVYAVISEDDIKYTIVFENNLPTGDICKDESLVFNFLGKQIEVVDFAEDEVTFKKVDEKIVNEGDLIIVNEYTVLLDMVGDDFVYVTIGSESEKISEGKTKKVGGVEVYVSEVLYTSKETKVSKAILAIGNDVEETVQDGDEYEEDSIWNWIVDSSTNTLGIILSEEFKDLDEEYKPLGKADKICLPNDYVCVEFNGLSDEDYSEYKFDYDYTDDETEIKGDFEVGTEDVDTILINSTGMFYEDEEGDLQDASNVIINLKDSDETLSYTNEIISIGDLDILSDVSSIEVNSEDKTEEGKYRSIYGSIVEIKNDLDEDDDDDNELSVLVPEKELELSFLVY